MQIFCSWQTDVISRLNWREKRRYHDTDHYPVPSDCHVSHMLSHWKFLAGGEMKRKTIKFLCAWESMIKIWSSLSQKWSFWEASMRKAHAMIFFGLAQVGQDVISCCVFEQYKQPALFQSKQNDCRICWRITWTWATLKHILVKFCYNAALPSLLRSLLTLLLIFWRHF